MTVTERKRAACYRSATEADRDGIPIDRRCGTCDRSEWSERALKRLRCIEHEHATTPRASCKSFAPQAQAPSLSIDEQIRIHRRVSGDLTLSQRQRDDALHQLRQLEAEQRRRSAADE